MSVAVVLPTYNESENLRPMVSRLREVLPDIRIVIADDNSPDGTGRLADECALEFGNIDVLHRPGKQGLGNAYRHGFSHVFGSDVDVIVTMDVDFSHDPAVIPNMLNAIEAGADAVVGSRYVRGGGTVNWPIHRRLLSRWGNLYTGALLGVKVRDCTSGFRAYRRSALQSIAPETTVADGYAFLTELVLRLARSGYSIVEVPITFKEREFGTSKMSGRIIVESMLLVTRWGVRARWKRAIAATRRR
ncbi:MAG: polyprenol monophosphomannose synthase [Actinobacteria bacterium]|nr:polyprenol monophosphomannose synthase [Actinomycetota bacterium]